MLGAFVLFFSLSKEYQRLSEELKRLQDLLSQHGIAHKGDSGEGFLVLFFSLSVQKVNIQMLVLVNSKD